MVCRIFCPDQALWCVKMFPGELPGCDSSPLAALPASTAGEAGCETDLGFIHKQYNLGYLFYGDVSTIKKKAKMEGPHPFRGAEGTEELDIRVKCCKIFKRS